MPMGIHTPSSIMQDSKIVKLNLGIFVLTKISLTIQVSLINYFGSSADRFDYPD